MNQKYIIGIVMLLFAVSVFATPTVAQQTVDYDWNNPCDSSCNESEFTNPKYGFVGSTVELQSSEKFETKRVTSGSDSFSKVAVWYTAPEDATVSITVYNSDTSEIIEQKTLTEDKTNGEPIVFNKTPVNTPLNVEITADSDIEITGVGVYTHQTVDETIPFEGVVSQDMSGFNGTPDMSSTPQNNTTGQPDDTDTSNGLFDSIFGIFFLIGIGILVLFLLLLIIGKIKQ